MQFFSHGPLAIHLPDGWSGRVLYLDQDGAQFVLQAANFLLPDQAAAAPPVELALGEEDRLKSLASGDILISVSTSETASPSAVEDPRLSMGDFLDNDSPRVPAGQYLAANSLSLNGGTFDLTVSFGGSSPSEIAVVQANSVLSTLSA